MKEDTGRYPYLSLVDRPKIAWPKGARVALWVSPNIEFYELTPPSNPGRAVWSRPNPDILSYSQRDYGNRVGVWRLMEVMSRFGVRGSRIPQRRCATTFRKSSMRARSWGGSFSAMASTTHA